MWIACTGAGRCRTQPPGGGSSSAVLRRTTSPHRPFGPGPLCESFLLKAMSICRKGVLHVLTAQIEAN
jgi:hypothetical protein